MPDIINIQRINALPEKREASTVYIVKTETPGRVDIFFTNNAGNELYRLANVEDIPGVVSETLEQWIPNLSLTAEEFQTPINISLVGSVQGTGVVTGKDDITISTSLVGESPEPQPTEVDPDIIEIAGSYLDPGPGNREMYLIPRKTPDPAWPDHREWFPNGDRTFSVYTGFISVSTIAADGTFKFCIWDISLTIRDGWAGYIDTYASKVTVKARTPNDGSIKWDIFTGSVNQELFPNNEISQPAAGFLKFRTEDTVANGMNSIEFSGKLRRMVVDLHHQPKE